MHFSHGVVTKQTVPAIGPRSHRALPLRAKNNPGKLPQHRMGPLHKRPHIPNTHKTTHSDFVRCFLTFQGLGGGLQSSLPITPWPTLSLTWWWGPTGAGTLWKVRKLEGLGGVCRGLEEAAIVWSFVTDKQHSFHDSASFGAESVFVNLISPPGQLLLSNT